MQNLRVFARKIINKVLICTIMLFGTIWGQDEAAKSVWVTGDAAITGPLSVAGNFSIYRETGSDPFKVTFGHESATGYGGHSLSAGYFDHITNISAEKTFTRGIHNIFLELFYKSNDFGLQEKSDNIADIAGISLGGGVEYIARFLTPTQNRNTSIALDTKIALSWYARYGSITENSQDIAPDPSESAIETTPSPLNAFERHVSIFNFSPKLSMPWSAGQLSGDLGARLLIMRDVDNIYRVRDSGRVVPYFNIRYDFITIDKPQAPNDDDVLDTPLNSSDSAGGDPTASASAESASPPSNASYSPFDTNVFGLFGKMEVVAGNTTGCHVCLVPFEIGLDSKFVTGLSSLRASVLLSGGLSATSNSVGRLESDYRAALADGFFDDTLNWFCKLDFALPLEEMFTFNFGVEFLTTALNQGLIEPLYSEKDSPHRGLYLFDDVHLNQFNSSIMVSFTHSLSSMGGLVSCYLDWVSHWVDVPVAAVGNCLTFDITLTDKTGRFSFSSNIAAFFGEHADYMPSWAFDFSVYVTNYIALSVFSRDFLKLVTAMERDYYDSVYTMRGGVAGVAVKFRF